MLSRLDTLIGARKPRIRQIPERAVSMSTGDAAVELAEIAGLNLDPWEQDVLRESLGETPERKWAAFEVGIVCARQNGKTEILIARMLAGLFLLEERLIIFSAHQFDTALEAFQRLQDVIEAVPEFSARVAKITIANGKEGITLKSGQKVKFKARTKKGGRGFTADCLIYDEAMDLPDNAHGSTLPTLSARPNPQVWYAASAVDQWQHENGIVLTRIRDRAIEGDDDALAYFEWSIDAENPEEVTATIATDPLNWAEANPALGIRISTEHVAREQRAMGNREFAVERLGVGDWPRTDGLAETVLDTGAWAELLDVDSQMLDPVYLAWDTTPDRYMTAIAAAGKREDDLWHVEVIRHKRGSGWLAADLAELVKAHKPSGVGADKGSPAGVLISDVNDMLSIEVEEFNGRDYANACGMFFDAVADRTLRHPGSPELDDAVSVATKRSLGEAWAWARQSGDISPLVAASLALWGARNAEGASVYEDRGVIVLD
ncbi:MAG TPA: terminase family protein [Solirubrobacterales bacterium]|nr:terminase family protein [Solirubrobacterales bacterium]